MGPASKDDPHAILKDLDLDFAFRYVHVFVFRGGGGWQFRAVQEALGQDSLLPELLAQPCGCCRLSFVLDARAVRMHEDWGTAGHVTCTPGIPC